MSKKTKDAEAEGEVKKKKKKKPESLESLVEGQLSALSSAPSLADAEEEESSELDDAMSSSDIDDTSEETTVEVDKADEGVEVEFSADGEDEEDEDEDSEEEPDLIILFKEKCTTCSHLVAHATKAYNKCHFSNGNADCPAASLRLAVGMPIDATAAKLVKAKLDGNFQREHTLRELLLAKVDASIIALIAKREIEFIRDPDLMP